MVPVEWAAEWRRALSLLEFLLVLVSVVIGLGLAAILSGAAGLLRDRERVQLYWIHTLFQVGIFLALVQQWWETWDLQGVGELSFWAVLTLLASPVLLYVIADLLFPRVPEGADLRSYYYQQAPMLWGLVMIGTVVGTFLRPLTMDLDLFATTNLTGLPTILVAVVLIRSKNPKVHAVLAPAMILVLLIDTLLAGTAIAG